MSARIHEFREAVEHLPDGATLVLVSYDDGKVNIESPLLEREDCKEFISRVIYAAAEEADQDIQGAGSTTLKTKAHRKAVEADGCFYIANARRVIGKRRIDLKVDPPPDLAIEIDATNKSQAKFPIFAALRLPEIWLYDTKQARLIMYELSGETFVEITASRAFPFLTSALVTGFIEQSRNHGQKAALMAFRQWLKSRS
jgi:Uma2 family endonuclease